MLQEEHIRKEVRNKISSNTIMSGWSKQQGIAYSLYENQKKYDKKYGNRADGEPKVKAVAGQLGDSEGSLGGGYITTENYIGKKGKYKFEGLGGLVAQGTYDYMNEYDWTQMWEILKKRGLAKNTLKTYKLNLERMRDVKNPTTGEFILPIIRTWDPQEFALAIIRRVFEGWDHTTKYYNQSNIRPRIYNPLLEALLFGMGTHPLPTEEMVELAKKYPHSASREKATIAALLVALNANKEEFVIKATNNYNRHNLIPSLKKRATFLQKAYHKEVESKNPKEEKNWVEWSQIVKRAGETRTEWNAYLEKKKLPLINNNNYATFFKAEQKRQNELLKLEVPKLSKAKRNKMIAGMRDGFFEAYFTPYLKHFNKPFNSKLMDALIATLYTEMPPRRLDWKKLWVITAENLEELCAEATLPIGENDDENDQSEVKCDGVEGDEIWDRIWYVIPSKWNPFSSKGYFLFGRNAGKSPQPTELKVDNINSNLRTLIGTLYSLLIVNNPEWEEWSMGGSPLMVNAMVRAEQVEDEEPDYTELTENSIGKKVKKIFSGKYGGTQKTITSSLLRKIYISNMFQGDTEKKAQIARLMNHSVRIQQHIYNKEGDITPDDFMKIESNLISLSTKK
jgi:hypothetical protein